ncbi:hypothetical protein SAMN05444401_3543 [Clostridium amylolyticum]|uniref:Phage major tail protein, phi13 family n=1 Tax=Clostridium amylolyticum TaxID=1121298 RepID=A0A1M6KYL3_9CLOT|nr:phage tail protein [Clostridium amylolyticum]SHJ64055.1 hypothetical protein SAMN05444401_3543 [Clostridium amylolyticum]
MATEIKEFDPMRIKNASIQVKDKQAMKFGCIGSVEGETEMRTVTKKCEGVITKSKSMPLQHNLTLSGFVPIDVYREVFGIKNEGLKKGVYAYSMDSKGSNFILTADVIDDFEDIVKLIAFPNVSSATGLKFTVDNDADEVAYMELEFTAMPDEARNFYYEAFKSEVEESVATAWHTNFNYELVKSTTPGV